MRRDLIRLQFADVQFPRQQRRIIQLQPLLHLFPRPGLRRRTGGGECEFCACAPTPQPYPPSTMNAAIRRRMVIWDPYFQSTSLRSIRQ